MTEFTLLLFSNAKYFYLNLVRCCCTHPLLLLLFTRLILDSLTWLHKLSLNWMFGVGIPTQNLHCKLQPNQYNAAAAASDDDDVIQLRGRHWNRVLI